MWNAIKRFFGFGKPEPIVIPEPIITKLKPVPKIKHSRSNVKRIDYYRRNGGYYSCDGDSLIEDLLLLEVLEEIFMEWDEENIINAVEVIDAENDVYVDGEEATLDNLGVDLTPVEQEVASTVAEINAAVEAVRETIPEPEPYVAPKPAYVAPEPAYVAPEPAYVAPEPERSTYSGGSSYSGGDSYSGGSDSSSSDSSSSDSGGGSSD